MKPDDPPRIVTRMQDLLIGLIFIGWTIVGGACLAFVLWLVFSYGAFTK